MAWANSQMLEVLGRLPDEAINFSAWNPDWTVGGIVHHIVTAEGRLISRLQHETAPGDIAVPSAASGISDLSELFKSREAQLLALIDSPEQPHSFKRLGNQAEFLTSTILAQAVHHSSEHRAQISDILATNSMNVFNLDDIDFWAFEIWETQNPS